MWFVHHRINRMNPCLTSRSSAPAPQGSLVFSGFVGWRGALIVGVGHVEERARAPGGRVHGVILPWLCWKGKHPFAPRDFLGLGSRSRCVGLFQPPGVPTRRGASRPAHGCPARPWDGFQAGPPAFVLARLAGGVSALSEAQPGAQGDAGLRFGLFPPSLVRPRPLVRAFVIFL